MHVCPYDGVVYKLARPGEHVAYFPFVLAQDPMRNPLGMFDNVMVNMRNRMEEMHRNFVSVVTSSGSVSSFFVLLLLQTLCVCVCFQENICTDSNTHSFSSSSVMTYSKVGNEPPKVFQASSSTRCAPGGVGSPTLCVTRAG